MIFYFGAELIQLLKLELSVTFVTNRAFPPLIGVTVSNFTQVPNAVVALSSVAVSNVGAVTLSHNAHKLDHGKSQINLMNPQTLPTPVIAAKLYHYLEV